MSKMKKKTKVILIVISVFAVLFIAGLILFLVFSGKGKGREGREQMQMHSMGDFGEGVVSASGLTSVGMSEEMLELSFLETQLYVEGSFLSTGDVVEAGTEIFRVSEESLQSAAKELADAKKEAELAYRQGVIDYELALLEAENTYETATINKKYAQAEYDSEVRKAKETVTSLESQVEEARALAEEYEKSETEDYYRSYYKVQELYDIYYEHYTLWLDMYEKWNIKELKSLYGDNVPTIDSYSPTSKSSASSEDETGMDMENVSFQAASLNDNKPEGMPEGMPDEMPDGKPEGENPEGAQEGEGEEGEGMPGGMSGFGGMGKKNIATASENEQKLAVYNLLDEMVKAEGEAYVAARDNYELAKKQAAAGLLEAQSNLMKLEAELEQARTTYEKNVISAKATYETTIAESENAQAVYETTCQSLKETLDALEAEHEETTEHLEYFNEMLGEGRFYTRKAGTIVVNTVREGNYLSGDTMVIAYSNPETVTVSASVAQEDVAKIAVGDEATVVISEYGNYTGKVTDINPVTQASSRLAVTYQVTVTLEGDLSKLESNLTAYVYFGMEMPKGQRGAGNERKMDKR